MKQCLLVAACVFAGTFALAGVLLLLRYLLWPLWGWLERYFEWCDTFKSEFLRYLFGLTPIVATVLALLVLAGCLLERLS